MINLNEVKQVVTVAGNDSDGSAGMPADLHTFFLSDVYGMGILTAGVAGNSYEISDQVIMPTTFVENQFSALRSDFNISATKTGMLGSSEIIYCFRSNYSKDYFGALVVDPVIVTKHGNMLLDRQAYDDFKDLIVPLADVITPNIYEAEVLSGQKIDSKETMISAAKCIQQMGAKNVVIKGEHNNPSQKVVFDYVLTSSGEEQWYSMPYVNTKHINGTGDVFSAKITAEIAKGKGIFSAVSDAKHFVFNAINSPLNVGHNYGPINIWKA